MENDKNRKMNNDRKDNSKRNSLASSCKPCTPLERNGNAKEQSSTASNPSSSYSTNTSSCYAKCKTQYIEQAPSINADAKNKDITEADLSKSEAKSSNDGCEIKPLSVTNPYIEKMEEDILYHIALGNKSHDLPKMFGDVKFVVMGGTPKRMEQFAYFIASQIGYELPAGTVLNDISKNSHRYAMFKVGPVLSVSHGMGTPSIGILLHELIKLMSHAGVKNPLFVRIATCGGFNKKSGTVVVSNKVINDFMEPFYELAILGKKIRFPANLNQSIVKEILACSEPEDKFETIAGVTYCTDNFYEGSGRADGAICEFSEQDAINYYKELQKNGVVNVEMESLAFAALTCRAGIKSAIVTVILSDRLETDQIKQPKEVLDEWQTRPQKLLARYIKKKLPDISRQITSSTTSRSWTTTDATSRTPLSNVYSVCKPCTGADTKAAGGVDTGGTTSKPVTTLPTTIGTGLSNTTKSSDGFTCKPCTNIPTTTSSILSETKSSNGMTCKPVAGIPTISNAGLSNTTKSASGTSKPASNEPSVCKPCILGSSTKPVASASAKTTPQTTAKSSIGANGSSSVCKPCAGSNNSISTTQLTSQAPETTAGTCKPCSGKDTSQMKTSKPADEVTSKPTSIAQNDGAIDRKRSKCVPVKCYTSEKVDDTTPIPTTPKTYVAKDFDSSSKSTISNDSWRSCYQKCSKVPFSNGGTSLPQAGSTSTTTPKPSGFQTPEQDKMKGMPTDQLGPCCSSKTQVKEVEDNKGPCCSGKSDDSSSSDECTGGEENRVEEIDRKNQELNDEKSGLATERRKSFSTIKESNSDNQLGPCCPGYQKEVTMKPVDSKALGRFCLGNPDDDSPEEPCDDRTDKSQGITEEKKTNEGAAPVQSNIQGCPISIRTPCPYFDGSNSASDPQTQTTSSVKLETTSTTLNPGYSTPKPSHDTPDTSTTRAMPSFVTPTLPLSKGSICCSKFSGSSTATVHSFINKEANKYDESPSPCAACKKYQESKNKSSGSTPSDSQPEIIKCAHKLKRLKEECQGYD